MKPEPIAAAFEAFVAAFNSGDPAAFAAAIVDDESSFVAGTQRIASGRTEWLGNYQELVDRGLVGPDGAGLRLEAGNVRGFDEGRAGWAFAWLTFVFPDGARLPTRATVVLRTEGDRWRVRHAHLSVAVPDDVAKERVAGWLKELGQSAA